MVPDISPSQLETLSMGQTRFERYRLRVLAKFECLTAFILDVTYLRYIQTQVCHDTRTTVCR